MPFTNDTKPTSSYSNDTKPTISAASIEAGQPIGLALIFTYAEAVGGSNNYTYDSKPS